MKQVIFFLVCVFIVAGTLPVGAQEASSSKELVIDKQELVINKQELVNALRQISDAVWDMEELKARPQVEELALQYRLDRLEKMMIDLSLYLGLRPTGAGGHSSIVIDRDRDLPVSVYYPWQLGAPGSQGQPGSARYPSTYQELPADSTSLGYSLAARQLLQSNSTRSDSLLSLMHTLSFQLDSLQRLVYAETVQAADLSLTDELRDSRSMPDSLAVLDPVNAYESVTLPVKPAQPAFDRFKSQVFFAVSSAALTSEGKDALEEIVNIMKRDDGLVATVSGSSSREGDTVYNKLLARKRAESVRDYLTDAGIQVERIVLESTGIDNESDLLLYGRRVDIVLSLKKG